MDDKTMAWMRKRLQDADYLERQIREASQTKRYILDRDAAICARNDAGNHYHVMQLPDEARAVCVKQIDERIAELEKDLAEL